MHPTLLEVPSLGITLASYHACLLLAVIVCFAIGPRWVAALEGLDRRRVFRAMLLLGVAVFAGARFHFVLNQWASFADHPVDVLRIWSGGLHAGGGIVLLALAAPLALRWLALPVGRFADGFVPTVGIGIAIARLGCFLHGCCFGTLCAWPWGVSFPRDTYIYQYHADLGVLPPGAAHTLPIHPLPALLRRRRPDDHRRRPVAASPQALRRRGRSGEPRPLLDQHRRPRVLARGPPAARLLGAAAAAHLGGLRHDCRRTGGARRRRAGAPPRRGSVPERSRTIAPSPSLPPRQTPPDIA